MKKKTLVWWRKSKITPRRICHIVIQAPHVSHILLTHIIGKLFEVYLTLTQTGNRQREAGCVIRRKEF